MHHQTLERVRTTRPWQRRRVSLQRDFLTGLALNDLTPHDGALDDVDRFYGARLTGGSLDRGRLLLQHAYQQATGDTPPEPVIALDWLERRGISGRHLDIGSGVGVTTQLFVRRGWSSSLAEVSTPVLDFARFRLGRRGVGANMFDLSLDKRLPQERFDAITAFRVFTHVRDVERAAQMVCSALAPSGTLFVEKRRLAGTEQGHAVGPVLRGLGLRPLRTFGSIAAYRAA